MGVCSHWWNTNAYHRWDDLPLGNANLIVEWVTLKSPFPLCILYSWLSSYSGLQLRTRKSQVTCQMRNIETGLYTILYYTTLYYTILYCTILYYTILYIYICTILYNKVECPVCSLLYPCSVSLFSLVSSALCFTTKYEDYMNFTISYNDFLLWSFLI